MNVKISKWGNSLAVRIPSNIARSIHLREGVDLDRLKKMEKDRLRRKKYSLDTLLSRVKKENIHSKVETIRAGAKEW